MSDIQRLPDGTLWTRTPYGRACIAPSGLAHVTANGNETYRWAHRAGAEWPCSDLATHAFNATFGPNGDLIDYEGPDGVSGAELDAVSSDLLSAVAPAHPAIRG